MIKLLIKRITNFEIEDFIDDFLENHTHIVTVFVCLMIILSTMDYTSFFEWIYGYKR